MLQVITNTHKMPHLLVKAALELILDRLLVIRLILLSGSETECIGRFTVTGSELPVITVGSKLIV